MPEAKRPLERAQSSMAPMLNATTSSQASEPEDVYTPVTDDVPVHLLIQSVLTLTLALVLALGLGAISYVMIDGFTFVTLDANNISDSRKSELLDEYNTYAGAISSVVSMPFQQVLTLVLPVFVLCFAASTGVTDSSSFVRKWAPVIAATAVSWLLGQGLNAVNVQFDQPTIEFVISSSDLVSLDSSAYAMTVTNITNTVNVAGISSTDTILRTAIRSSRPSPKTSCSYDSGWGVGAPIAGSIRFGFALNSWLENMLPTSVASDSSLHFSTSSEFAAGSVKESDLPNDWTLNKTANIFSFGLGVVLDVFTDGSRVPRDVFEQIDTSEATTMLTQMQAVTKNQSWKNISTSEITIELSSLQLSPQVQFDAVTFELPVTWAKMGGKQIGSDYYSWFETINQCNDYACVFQTTISSSAGFGYNDQVRVLHLCAAQENDTTDDISSVFSDDCIPMNNSVLIFSLAQHIAIDEVNVTVDSLTYMNVSMKNTRKIYSATIAKLTWQTSDLAQVYGAKCAADGACDGLYFPLENVNQHLVLGKANIPTLTTPYTPATYTQWQALVVADNQVDAAYLVDLIYPPIYKTGKGTNAEWGPSGSNCSFYGSDYINDLMLRHIYSKDPMQPAYTAGLFWLFQNAAVRDVQTTSKTQAGIQLDFDGNLSWLSARVSMPQTSAFITFAGCLLVLLAGVFVPVYSRSKGVQNDIQLMLSSAHNVASVMFNKSDYPPLVVKAVINQSMHDPKTRSTSPLENLQQYSITEMTLRCKTETQENVVEIVDQRKSQS